LLQQRANLLRRSSALASQSKSRSPSHSPFGTAASSSSSRSKSRSSVELAERARVAATPNATLHELSPVFASNLTYPTPYGQHHRNFSILCVTLNGNAIALEDVQPFLPYEGMDRSELEHQHHMRGVGESEDYVTFGCPEAEGVSSGVPKVAGSASEDL
jgi:hypothetical protein